MKQSIKIVCVVGAVLAVSACTAGTAESQHAAAGGDLSQLLLGFWHGLIAPVTLIVEVVNRFAPHLLPWSLHLYESKDTGVLYDVGFYFGLVSSPSLAFRGWARRG
jgi:hypothetical protein